MIIIIVNVTRIPPGLSQSGQGSHLEASRGPVGALLRPLGGLLEASWGASWGPLEGLWGGLLGEGELEASWRAPGGLLGPSGGPLKKYEKTKGFGPGGQLLL